MSRFDVIYKNVDFLEKKIAFSKRV